MGSPPWRLSGAGFPAILFLNHISKVTGAPDPPNGPRAPRYSREVAVLRFQQLERPAPSSIPELDGLSDHERERDGIFRYFRLHLEPREVEYHWQRLLMHQSRFPAPEGRKVDLRTAAFDYFLNETDLLAEPMVMERAELRQTELMAYLDYLTGLRNYAYFESEIKTEVARAKRYQTSLCLLLCDLDGFKHVNDSLGHRTGNDVLREVGQILQKRLRGTDLIARFGGDEFAVLLHRTDPENGLRVADKLCASIDVATRRRFPWRVTYDTPSNPSNATGNNHNPSAAR